MVAVNGAVYGIILSAIFIDILTLIIVGIAWPFMKKRRRYRKDNLPNVSIIIPCYNEEKNIANTIKHAFNQTHIPKKVIVIDDFSTDKSYEICISLIKKYPNLIVEKQKENKGKAFNITYALNKYSLEEIIIVLDADTFISKNYIEEIIKPFINKRVVISTGISIPVKHKNFFGRVIYNGSVFQYKFFAFRKQAQHYRNAISVVCGDSAAYRTSFLREMNGFPLGTQTEDMDLTWLALEKGYRISFQRKARATSVDAGTFKGHWKQITRWYSGFFQGLFKHGRQLTKAKPLLFTTLIPSYFDSFIYAMSFLIMPFVFFLYKPFFIWFFTADLIFTSIAVLLVDWKNLIHIMEIYMIKFLWSFAWLYAGAKTAVQFLGGKRYWGGKWDRSSYYKGLRF